MARRKVFISYSTKDRADLDALREKLHYFETHGGLECFADYGIKPGDKWRDEIQRAIDEARIAVLLISDAFLSSKYIAEHELPKLVALAEAKEVRLLLVHLRPSQIAAATVSVDGRRIQLDSYQGLNRPNETLQHLASEAARGDELVRIAHAIVAEAKQLLSPEPPKTSSRQPIVRRSLWVRIKEEGTNLRLTYSCDAVDQFVSRPIPESAVRPAIDRYFAEPSEESSLVLGDVLGTLLLGSAERSEDIERVLRETHGLPRGDRADPASLPTRLRIQTAAKLLECVPWSLARWKDQPLVLDGWTFERVIDLNLRQRQRLRDEHFSAPCLVTFLFGGTRASAAEYRQQQEGFFQQIWPGSPELDFAFDLGHAERSLRVRAPSVVSYFGPAVRIDGELAIEIGHSDGTPASQYLKLSALRDWFYPDSPPSVLLLNFVGELTRPDCSLPTSLREAVPLIVETWGSPKERAALRRAQRDWFSSVFRSDENEDLIVAASRERGLHRVVHTSCRDLRATVLRAAKRHAMAERLLDRDHQRSFTLNSIGELLLDRDQRALALLSCADTGNLISHLSRTLRDHVHDQRSDWQLIMLDVDLPDLAIPITRDRIREAAFGLGERSSVDAIMKKLRALALPTKPRARAIPFLAFPVLSTSDLDLARNVASAFLDFCANDLAANLPDDLPVVCHLPIETKQGFAEPLHRILDDLRSVKAIRERQSLRADLLDVLRPVTELHLHRFFSDSRKASIDPGRRDEVVEKIYQKSDGGQFEKCVEMITQGNMDRFESLLAESDEERE